MVQFFSECQSLMMKVVKKIEHFDDIDYFLNSNDYYSSDFSAYIIHDFRSNHSAVNIKHGAMTLGMHIVFLFISCFSSLTKIKMVPR